jgi:hypothetical protein
MVQQDQNMKNFFALLFALVLLSGNALAEPSSTLLPSAPAPVAAKKPVLGDWNLAGSVVATRVLDWTSTEECIRRPWCHEAELPNALVHNKVGFAAFEGAMSVASILPQYELTKHGHRKLAWLGQAVDVGVMAYTVNVNYRRDTTPVK